MRIHSGAAGFCVTAALAAVVTAGFSWIVVVLGWSVGTLIMLVLPLLRRRERVVPAAVPLIFGLAAMTAAALGAERAFPADSTFPFVSFMLLLLLWRALCGEREGPRRVTAVLGLILLPVFAVVLLLGLREVPREESMSGRAGWFQAVIAVAAASPWWSLEESKRDLRGWMWYGGAAGVSLGLSLLTHGTLGAALAEAERFSLYRAVQTVHILNTVQHMETLVAAAVLMGSFGILLTLGEMTARALERASGSKGRWRIAALLGMVFLLEWMIRRLSGEAVLSMKTVFWGLVPLVMLWVVLFTKSEKTS